MGGALFWGLFAASSLILGGAIALVFRVSERMLGLIMAFGAGVLISAVAYDLVADAFESSAGTEASRSAGRRRADVLRRGLLIDRMGGGPQVDRAAPGPDGIRPRDRARDRPRRHPRVGRDRVGAALG